MPELPDVDYFRRYVEATSLHQGILHTHCSDDRIIRNVSPQKLARRLKHEQFRRVRRHGKFLFAGFDEQWLVLHFGMTGALTYSTEPEDPPYARVSIEFDNGARLADQSKRLLGQVSLTREPEEFVGQQNLGPDALSGELTVDRFRSLLRSHRKAVKSVLMDQSILAGIGNVYADEILFQTRLLPTARPDELQEKRLTELYHVMRRVLRVTARHNADVKSFPRGYLLPHRDDETCPRCGRELRAETISGRTTYYCTRCQQGW